jgi:hypothetical protein
MGLRFRQSFQLFPGVRINISKSGISTSIGVPGATMNFGPRGVTTTLGIPGTGISYSNRLPAAGPRPAEGGNLYQPQVLPREEPAYFSDPELRRSDQPNIWIPQPGMRAIASASVESLTSESLRDLRDMVVAARRQRNEVDRDLGEARQLLADQKRELERRRGSLFRWFYKKRIAALEGDVPVTSAEIDRLAGWSKETVIRMDFEETERARAAYATLVRAFSALTSSNRQWDLTSDRDTDRVKERTVANRTIERHPIRVEFARNDLIEFDGQAMRFENHNGEDIYIYPGIALMPRADSAFALIDIREVDLQASGTNFHEHEDVPPDAEVTGNTWAKANKDGSPDRRFSNNYAIPVCAYGLVTFRSAGGVHEEYMFSNLHATVGFSLAFDAYQESLKK